MTVLQTAEKSNRRLDCISSWQPCIRTDGSTNNQRHVYHRDPHSSGELVHLWMTKVMMKVERVSEAAQKVDKEPYHGTVLLERKMTASLCNEPQRESHTLGYDYRNHLKRQNNIFYAVFHLRKNLQEGIFLTSMPSRDMYVDHVDMCEQYRIILKGRDPG